MSAITRILPKRRLSRWMGHLMHWEGPKWWTNLSIKSFANMYNINLDEAEKSYNEYTSIGDFFVRRLKSGIRPIGEGFAVHPADSKITQCAAIDGGTLIQAKGITYSLKGFTQDPEAEKKWAGGMFMTYYLCPTDYHRVHSPVDGEITDVRYMPGQLWPVNEWSTTNIKDLFTVNERVLIEIQTELGPVGVMFVGATNVGYICLSFDESIKGNQKGPHIFQHKKYTPEILTHKGAELGMFRMGSTVVMLYPPAFRQKYEGKMDLGPVVRVNAPLTGKI
ncbi:archaetidylserine decarboxylase [Bdellovibrio reynosensis]|uniref:phosphatidylserine decarboxylase n=1 Tax=Bdellovibrio reynosensis TaxID=2835041 RepID=A0ABY4CE03_9BACT|nr:archaetidylserine decarboxylase [Bdellovibrio reynosensis]UOF02117.1 archaetidylserine decarboxylase [Bdellovibrio reynosensis]